MPAPSRRHSPGGSAYCPAKFQSRTGTSKRPSVMTMVLVSPVVQSVLTAVPAKVQTKRPYSTDVMEMLPLVNE